jgi:hypothetical protein
VRNARQHSNQHDEWQRGMPTAVSRHDRSVRQRQKYRSKRDSGDYGSEGYTDVRIFCNLRQMCDVAKSTKNIALDHQASALDVEKNHPLRLHIGQCGVELLSPPTKSRKHGAGSWE